MNAEQILARRKIMLAAELLNKTVRDAREAHGLDTMLAVNEPKPPLGVQSVHPVVSELEDAH